MRVTVETMIEASPARVFAVLTDVPRWQGRIRAIAEIEMLTSGPPTVGTRFRETRTMFGRSATEEMTVAELVPPHRFVLAAENHGTRYRITHTLAEAGAGTRLALVFEAEPITLMARLLAPLGWAMKRGIARQIGADLADLKGAAEG